MDSHPAVALSLYVTDRKILVVGDGGSVERRIAMFSVAGAMVEHVSAANWHADLCQGAFIVVAAGQDNKHNGRVAQQAKAAGCLQYAQDQPEISAFAMPALIARGPLKVAISTDAVAPALSRRLREQLQGLLDSAGDDLDELIASMADLRSQLPPGERGKPLSEAAGRLSIQGTCRIAADTPRVLSGKSP